MELDRVKQGLLSLVSSAVSPTDFHALYPSRVVAQNADGTLELRPDSSRMPDMSGVPIRFGLPGTAAKVAAGARVLLGFENGDQQRPYAGAWDAAAPTELRLGGTDASQAAVHGDELKAQLELFIGAVTQYISTLSTAVTPTSAAQIAFESTMEGYTGAFLSSVVKVK